MSDDPLTEAQIAALRDQMEQQHEEVRVALAEDLGGEPNDYRAGRVLADALKGAGEGAEDGDS